jgi:putative ABC transport system permease protein
MTDWTIIGRSLAARAFSTATTIVTVAVAVGLMLVLLTMRDSGRKAFERGSGDMHLLVSRDASPLVAVLNGVFYAGAPRNYLEWSKYESLRASAPWAYAVPCQTGDSHAGLPVMATTRDFFDKFKPNPGEAWALASGRFFDKPFEVVVGAAAARRTGLRVGSTLYFSHGLKKPEGAANAPADDHADEHAEEDHAHDDHDHDHGEHGHEEFPYTVVGILAPTGGSHDRALFTDLTSSWIIHAHDRRERETPGIAATTEADLADSDRKITGIYLRLISREGSDTPANLPSVFDSLRRDTSITVASPSSEIEKLFAIVGNIDRILLAIAGAVLVSSGIAIMLALYNSMEQRRRQIAVLRVLGASRARIFGLVLTESAVIGLIGAAAGVLLGLAGAVVAAAQMKAQVGLAIDSVPTVLITIALACAAGIIPAVAAYRTSVAKNLRPLA